MQRSERTAGFVCWCYIELCERHTFLRLEKAYERKWSRESHSSWSWHSGLFDKQSLKALSTIVLGRSCTSSAKATLLVQRMNSTSIRYWRCVSMRRFSNPNDCIISISREATAVFAYTTCFMLKHNSWLIKQQSCKQLSCLFSERKRAFELANKSVLQGAKWRIRSRCRSDCPRRRRESWNVRRAKYLLWPFWNLR